LQAAGPGMRRSQEPLPAAVSRPVAENEFELVNQAVSTFRERQAIARFSAKRPFPCNARWRRLTLRVPEKKRVPGNAPRFDWRHFVHTEPCRYSRFQPALPTRADNALIFVDGDSANATGFGTS
jgi:hypothetical protein